jgi:hypothetical protein
VIRYRVTRSKDEHEVAFAPQLCCDLLEEKPASYNSIGIPTTWFHFIVRAYVTGEPKSESFYPPLGYAIRQK